MDNSSTLSYAFPTPSVSKVVKMKNIFCLHVAGIVSALAITASPVWADETRLAAQTGREQLHAVLWMQTAAEYRALAAQTWALARERLHTAEQPGSAALEQADMPAAQLASLPTAVIVDLDETVLDNSYFQARLVRDHKPYSDAAWDAWAAESAAQLVPGAREFLDEAARLGHRIFYVTNRECPKSAPLTGTESGTETGTDPCPPKTATQKNLIALGLPGAADPENLLLRRERPEWESNDKSERRAWLAQRYRIIAMAGDDLRDFVDRPIFEARRAELTKMFGTRWFILPNAMYGSWERSLNEGVCAPGSGSEDCARAILEHKYALLQTEPEPRDIAQRPHWDLARDRLRIATWNVEYLLEPSTYEALSKGCIKDNSRVAGAAREIPCDIVPRGRRGSADFAALRRYALQLDPDVIALEEVDGPGAARQVFPGYEFCFSARPNVQKNGFAIRRGLPFRCENEYLPISTGDLERRGVVLTLFPGTDNEMTLLGLHLRSGCPQGPLDNDKNQRCARLAAQLPALRDWIVAQARLGRRFALLGDFNRRLTLEDAADHDAAGQPQNVWPQINRPAVPGAALTNIVSKAPFKKCIPGDEYDSYIDTVIVGEALVPRIIKGSFQRVTYTRADAEQFKLSDHCPVGIELRLR